MYKYYGECINIIDIKREEKKQEKENNNKENHEDNHELDEISEILIKRLNKEEKLNEKVLHTAVFALKEIAFVFNRHIDLQDNKNDDQIQLIEKVKDRGSLGFNENINTIPRIKKGNLELIKMNYSEYKSHIDFIRWLTARDLFIKYDDTFYVQKEEPRYTLMQSNDLEINFGLQEYILSLPDKIITLKNIDEIKRKCLYNLEEIFKVCKFFGYNAKILENNDSHFNTDASVINFKELRCFVYKTILNDNILKSDFDIMNINYIYDTNLKKLVIKEKKISELKNIKYFINLKDLNIEDRILKDGLLENLNKLILDYELIEYCDDKNLKRRILERLFLEENKLQFIKCEFENTQFTSAKISTFELSLSVILNINYLDQYTNITELDISFLYLKEMPVELKEMVNLKILNMSYNKFYKFSDDIYNLKNLEKLDIDGNKITTLDEKIKNLTNLKYLDISSNDLIFPDIIYDLNNLEILISTFIDIKTLSDKIKNLNNLKILDISHNHLEYLPESIAELNKLENLNVSSNDLLCLPDTIGKFKKLKTLDVSKNKLMEIPDSLCDIFTLESLDVSRNKLKGLPDYISDLFNLRSINACCNYIKDMPSGLSDCVNLEKIDFSNNWLEISIDIRKLKKLKELELFDSGMQLKDYKLIPGLDKHSTLHIYY